jgi:hypothetical protein
MAVGPRDGCRHSPAVRYRHPGSKRRTHPVHDGAQDALAAPEHRDRGGGGDEVRTEHSAVRRARGIADRPEQQGVMMAGCGDGRSGRGVQGDEEHVEHALRQQHGRAQAENAEPPAHQDGCDRRQEDAESRDEQRMRCPAAADGVRHGRQGRRDGRRAGSAEESRLPERHDSSLCGGFLDLAQ